MQVPPKFLFNSLIRFEHLIKVTALVWTLILFTSLGPWMPHGALSSAGQSNQMAGSWPRHSQWRCASSWERRSLQPSTATGCCVPPIQYPSSFLPLSASLPAGRFPVWVPHIQISYKENRNIMDHNAVNHNVMIMWLWLNKIVNQ